MADITSRYFTAAGATTGPTPEQRAAVEKIRVHTVLLAQAIEDLVPAGRDKSIALTSVEDAQMRANRGLFAPPAQVDLCAH